MSSVSDKLSLSSVNSTKAKFIRINKENITETK